MACLCSSFASVYLEKILTESKPSIWVRNAQLCIFTIPIAFAGTLMVEDKYMRESGLSGMLHGFNGVVWAAIFTSGGGMIVAVVMKFAGNILRNFAQACAMSWGHRLAVFFGFQITARFVMGVALVIGSIFIYGSSLEQLLEWKAKAVSMLGNKKPPPSEKTPSRCAAAGRCRGRRGVPAEPPGPGAEAKGV